MHLTLAYSTSTTVEGINSVSQTLVLLISDMVLTSVIK